MNAMSEREFHLLADAVRHRQRATGDLETAESLDQHAIRTMSYLDDLAEGESINGMDYQVARAALILHDVAATKVRSSASALASAELASEMLFSIGADEAFISAVSLAVRSHQSEDAETCAELLVHDACLLARLESMPSEDLRPKLRTHSARRIAAGSAVEVAST